MATTIRISNNAEQYFGICNKINKSYPMIANVKIPHLIEMDIDETLLFNNVRLYRHYKGNLHIMCEISLLHRDINDICTK